MKTLARYSKKLSLFLAILSIVAFVSVAFFGMANSSFGMQMNEKNQMQGCIFDGYAKICTMMLTEHIQAWQNLFTTLPSKMTHFAFALLLFGFAFIGALIRRLYLVGTERLKSQRLYHTQNLDFQIFNFLKEAFSQGIINPKIYDLTTI